MPALLPMQPDQVSPFGPPRPRTGRLASLVVPLVIVLVATTAVAWVAIFGQPGAPPAAPAQVVAADSTASSTPPETAAPTDLPPSGSCEQHTVAAPAGGRWVIHRAEFGSRGSHDYLRLLLRRDGSAADAATMSAELIAASEMPARHGQDAPAGSERVLVARFDGPVRVTGQFGGRGSRALGAFTISARGGSAYVVAAINGERCFSVEGGAWASGQPTDNVEITLLIERG
jgi:hypothetical protein